jgi:hypothetical protein
MEEKEKPRSVSARSEDRRSHEKAMPSSSQTGIPAGISKAPWAPPVVESMGPVGEVTNGGSSMSP